MDDGVDDGAFTMIDTILQCANWVGHMPWFYYLSVWLAPITGIHLAITQRQGKLLQMSQQNIKDRKERGTDRNDMLEQFFEVQRAKPDKFDDVCIASMAASNIFAGSDSTSVSISAFLYHTLRNPGVKKRLIEEINEHAAKHNIPHGTVFDLEVINSMPFLQACMYEALRCHPAVGVSLGRVVPPSGLQIGKHSIPGGVRLVHPFKSLCVLILGSPVLVQTPGSSIGTRKFLVTTRTNSDQKGGWKTPTALPS